MLLIVCCASRRLPHPDHAAPAGKECESDVELNSQRVCVSGRLPSFVTMQLLRRRLRQTRIFWCLSVVAVWAIVGVLNDSRSRDLVRPRNYLSRPWSEEQDPKIPQPPKHPRVIRPSVQVRTGSRVLPC